MPDLPGREMPSGFDYSIPWDESPFALTYAEQKAWDEWLAENRRCHMRRRRSGSPPPSPGSPPAARRSE